jgi:hypothetical protein
VLAVFCVEYFHKLFAQGRLRTMILPISASHIAGITGVSHWCLPVAAEASITREFSAQGPMS